MKTAPVPVALPFRRGDALAAFGLLVCATVLGISGIDLVLPAVPSLPARLGGTAASAQFVLAAFAAGTGLGLAGFGELGARFDQRRLLAGSLAAYGLISLAATLASRLDVLVALRFWQGAASAAAAVFAPGMIRALFDKDRAVRALGLFGSIESLVPALAPLAGAWLLLRFDWRASFQVTGGLALGLAIAVVALNARLPRVPAATRAGGYLALLGDPVFLRYALSQALTLGGLLVFVFGAPAVIVGPLGGTLSDFVALQVTGVTAFILAANVGGRFAGRFGVEPTILGGTLLSAAGALAIVAYALAGGTDPRTLPVPFVFVNLGFGLRGPTGFMQAVLAAHGDDARGAAVVILAILLTAAGGTAVAAPFVASGLTGLASIAAAIISGGAISLLILPRSRRSAGAPGA